MAARETENFRRNVLSLCTEHGAIQRIADDAKITRPYLSKMLHGRATPSMDVAAAIAKALAIPLSELLQSPEKFMRNLARAS
ncbi:MAG: helix-turn-helix domain-containing protein [Patescibacteria group bacterium]|nr:helix-turn-helix domain-containing protein [Patescibacteria group bacterium]